MSFKLKKFKKIVSFGTVMAMLCSSSAVMIVNADEDPMMNYEKIVSEFNEEYGTNYQVSTPEQIERNGEDVNEVYNDILSMSDEEFWDYIYDAHVNASNIEVNNNAEVEIDVPNVSPRVSPVQTTQRYYYSGSSSKYLIMNATWVSVDGQNRYMSVQSFGEAKTGVYPSIHVTDYTYSFLNTAQQVRISYEYEKQIAAGIIDGTYYRSSVTFTANGGDVWGSMSV